jgi:short/branched chain acyl-CoA dehydrogenase
MKLRSNLTSR